MAKTKISEFSATPANNTDIDSINIAEGCAPSGINDAIRELMAQLKDFQTGAVGDSFNGPIGAATASTGAFTTLSASGTTTLSGLTASTALALDASKNVVSVTNTGTGNNVLATSPTLVTPALGTPSALVGTNITGTATSFNINGTVGATTPTTGAFTTLAASGNVTLSGGTANGVAYLNGSKVVTSGSALWFDGTNFGVGTAGNTINQQSVIYKIGANAVYQQIANGSTGLGATNGIRIGLTSAGVGEFYSPTAAISYIDGSEQMRLTSTGLGIGTSSPSYKFQVQKSADGGLAYFRNTSGSNQPAIYIKTNDSSNVVGFDTDYALSTSPAINFSTGGTERMRLDSSGNLGLGVTPSAWFSARRAIQFGQGGSVSASTNSSVAEFSSNAYIDASGNNIYLSTAAAARYQQSSGSHIWYNAPSGTAGNAITFTQAMSLTADGNLLVGTTSFGQPDVNGAAIGAADGAFRSHHATGTASGTIHAYFTYGGLGIGSITQNGTTAVAYNTSSDYRLKNITGSITTSGAYIDSLNPVEGTWKADGSTFVGLIAHEVQEASRTQVATGVKDGAEMQSMDYSNSELIANLIAEVKSLRQRVATLEAK